MQDPYLPPGISQWMLDGEDLPEKEEEDLMDDDSADEEERVEDTFTSVEDEQTQDPNQLKYV